MERTENKSHENLEGTQETLDTAGETSDKIDPADAADGQGSDHPCEADQVTPTTEARKSDTSGPDDPDHDLIGVHSQPANDETVHEGSETGADSDHDSEKGSKQKEAGPENTDIAAGAVGPAETQTNAAAERATADEDDNEAQQTAGSSQEELRPQMDAQAQSNAETDAEDDDADSATPEVQETGAQEDPAADNAQSVSMQPSSAKISLAKIAVSAVLIGAVFSGFFIFDNKSKIKTDKSENGLTLKDQAQGSKLKRKKIIDIQPVGTPTVYDSRINEISALRDSLLKKQAEVLALKQKYQHSIEELEKEVLDEQHKTDTQTFLEATGNKRIAFSLKTIQRRQAYINQLEQPLEWVTAACEDLLYIKRRVITDLQVSAVASGIDMDQHLEQMQRALEKYEPTADKLAIDPAESGLESLETIWQKVQNKQDLISPKPAYSKNQIISDQICAGDFNRIDELSEISTATAKCISRMHRSDLFLNQIDEISPGAARHLCQWNGRWICINGIKALSPRVAHYLFQWNGHIMSLNGLTEFPSEIGEKLLKWDGRQLELMGLQDAAETHERIGIEHLAEWERSGGKLFVPPKIREKINALHRQTG
jgi:hypothetical protein